MLHATQEFTIENSPFPAWYINTVGDGGWLYIIQQGDLVKVGKTKNPARRIRAAQTWLPTGKLVGMKPFWFVHEFERTLLCGIANYWLEGEWHQFPDASLSSFLIDGFRQFDNHDRNRNTLDFPYWINGSGMCEVVSEQNHRRISLRRFQREC